MKCSPILWEVDQAHSDGVESIDDSLILKGFFGTRGLYLHQIGQEQGEDIQQRFQSQELNPWRTRQWLIESVYGLVHRL